MGEARELMDRMTEAFVSKNLDALDGIYAQDVVAETPDVGTVRGLDKVKDWHRVMLEAFPDMTYEPKLALEDGDLAVDAGTAIGTNTGPMRQPDGTTLPPTGRTVRMRAMDVARVENGRIVQHDFYFDQLDMLTQLGLMTKEAPGATV